MTLVWPGWTIASELAISTATKTGIATRPGAELLASGMQMPMQMPMQMSATSTPSQPLIAQACRSLISTRAPSCPTVPALKVEIDAWASAPADDA